MQKNREELVFVKTLKPLNVWAIAFGTIIGFGCFVLPGDLITKAGPLGALIGIIFGGLLMLIIAKSYGYMVERFPEAGGEFAYTYKCFGRIHAFICGWLLTLAYLSIVPLNATALVVLIKFLAPSLFAKGYMYTVAGWDVYIAEVILSSTSIILFGYLNYRGIKDVGKIQLLMVGLLITTVLLIGGGTVLSPVASFLNLKPVFAMNKAPIAGILSVLAIAPWLYVGFDTIPQAAEEYDFSPTLAYRLIVWAIFFGGLMYGIVLLATGMVFSWQDLISSNLIWPAGAAMKASLGMIGVCFLVIAVSMAIFTGINGFYMAASRVLFSMGRAKVLPSWFNEVHPQHLTPVNAIIFTGVLSLLAPWFGRQVILWIVELSALGTAFGYMYTCFSAHFIYKASTNNEKIKFSFNKFYGLIGGFIAAGFLYLLTIPGSPGFMTIQSWYALIGWSVLGVVFYFFREKEYDNLSTNELDYLISRDISNKDSININLGNVPQANKL